MEAALLLTLLRQERLDRIQRYFTCSQLNDGLPHGWHYVRDWSSSGEPSKLNWTIQSTTGLVNVWFDPMAIGSAFRRGPNNWDSWNVWKDVRYSTFEPSPLVLQRIWELLEDTGWKASYRPLVDKRAKLVALERKGHSFELLDPYIPADPPLSYDARFSRSIIASVTLASGETLSFRKLEELESTIHFLEGVTTKRRPRAGSGSFSVELEVIRRFCGAVKQHDDVAGRAAFHVFKKLVSGRIDLSEAG